MSHWGIAAVAVVAIVLTEPLWRSANSPWKRRFGTMGSPLLEAPGYRVLFLLVVIGVLLISVLPEAAFVIPALDAVGLDIATILVALELRHYAISIARVPVVSSLAAIACRAPAEVVRRFGHLMPSHPVLWAYACMWPMIWLCTFLGKLRALPRTHL
jgi:hypothetical protein